MDTCWALYQIWKFFSVLSNMLNGYFGTYYRFTGILATGPEMISKSQCTCIWGLYPITVYQKFCCTGYAVTLRTQQEYLSKIFTENQIQWSLQDNITQIWCWASTECFCWMKWFCFLQQYCVARNKLETWKKYCHCS